MTALRYSAAALALFFASSMAYAEDSTTAKPQAGAARTMECPAAGTVAEADLTEECKDKASASTTEVPKTDTDTMTTGTTEVPKTGSGTAASGTTATDDTATATAPAAAATSVLASQFMGQTVYSAANENVGEINDLVLNKDLDTVTAIVGVGGFLGIGEKDVAIPIDQITVAKDANNALHLTIASTKEELEAAPAFDRTALN